MLQKIIKDVTLGLATVLLISGSAGAQPDTAQVTVKDAWLRATVAGQQGTGGFMKLMAQEHLRLVRVNSPVAEISEIHEMKMGANNVMEMRPIAKLELPKGKLVELKPGSYHLMLMGLKQTLAKDSKVPVTLYFKNSKGVESRLKVEMPVALASPTADPTQATSDKASKPMHQH